MKAADKLSQECLNGLTVLWGATYLVWNPNTPKVVLASAQETAAKLLEIGLPSENSWIRDADALNLLRIQSLTTRKKHSEWTRERVGAQYFHPGIDLNEHQGLVDVAVQMVPELGPLLNPHPLKSEFVLLPGVTADDLSAKLPQDLLSPPELNDLIEKNGYGTTDAQAVEEFDKLAAEQVSLVELGAWWDSLPFVDFSVIGEVVGFVNARRYLAINNAQSVGEMLKLRSSAG